MIYKVLIILTFVFLYSCGSSQAIKEQISKVDEVKPKSDFDITVSEKYKNALDQARNIMRSKDTHFFNTRPRSGVDPQFRKFMRPTGKLDNEFYVRVWPFLPEEATFQNWKKVLKSKIDNEEMYDFMALLKPTGKKLKFKFSLINTGNCSRIISTKKWTFARQELLKREKKLNCYSYRVQLLGSNSSISKKNDILMQDLLFDEMFRPLGIVVYSVVVNEQGLSSEGKVKQRKIPFHFKESFFSTGALWPLDIPNLYHYDHRHLVKRSSNQKSLYPIVKNQSTKKGSRWLELKTRSYFNEKIHVRWKEGSWFPQEIMTKNYYAVMGEL